MNARPSGYSSGLLVSTTTPTPLERTRLADHDAGHVVAALVEPAADRRIDAEVPNLEQRFAVAERGHVALCDREAVFGHRADRTAGEDDLTIPARAHVAHEERTVPVRRSCALAWGRAPGRGRRAHSGMALGGDGRGGHERDRPRPPLGHDRARAPGADRAIRRSRPRCSPSCAPFDAGQRAFVNHAGHGCRRGAACTATSRPSCRCACRACGSRTSKAAGRGPTIAT